MRTEQPAQRRPQTAGSAASADIVGLHTFARSGSQEGEPLIASGAQSLGASALSFERAVKAAVAVIAFGSTVSFGNDAKLAQALAPGDLQVLREHAASRQGQTTDALSGGEARSFDAIVAAVDEEAVEDGVTHRAEVLVSEHIRQFGIFGIAKRAMTVVPPARSASLLRLLGRTPDVDREVRRSLVIRGLASDSVEVRDAAVQAAENWEDASLADLLGNHREPVAWLAEYTGRVARDLRG